MKDFVPFDKIARLTREITVTEKIDGTNGSIYIGEDGEFLVGSRTRWVTPEDDNYGFAKWAHANREELVAGLGIGHHFGEWWGQGIQRNYSQPCKRFSLFNVSKWDENTMPTCCNSVPLLYNGVLDEHGVMKGVKEALRILREQGSVAAPGFMKPEGIVIFHHAAHLYFKKTLDKDEEWKGKQTLQAA